MIFSYCYFELINEKVNDQKLCASDNRNLTNKLEATKNAPKFQVRDNLQKQFIISEQ